MDFETESFPEKHKDEERPTIVKENNDENFSKSIYNPQARTLFICIFSNQEFNLNVSATNKLQSSKGDCNVIPLCQRLLSALISEESCSGSENLNFDAYDTQYETNGELELNHLDNSSLANYNFTSHSVCNGYRITQKPEHDDTRNDVEDIPSNGLRSSQKSPIITSSELEYDALDINDKLLLELKSIEISPESMPEISQTDDEGIFDDITRLEENYQRQVYKKKCLLEGLLKSSSVTKECQERDFEAHALDKLVVTAYEKYMACRGRNLSGGRNTSNKGAKQAALGFVKRTLEWYHQFEDTGKSYFKEPLFKDMFLAASSQRLVDGMEVKSSKPHISSCYLEARTGSISSWRSLSQFSPNMNNQDVNLSDIFPVINNSSEQTSGKEDLWSNSGKKRELSLDDVGASSAPSGIRDFLSSSKKGKRSERDRVGKGKSSLEAELPKSVGPHYLILKEKGNQNQSSSSQGFGLQLALPTQRLPTTSSHATSHVASKMIDKGTWLADAQTIPSRESSHEIRSNIIGSPMIHAPK